MITRGRAVPEAEEREPSFYREHRAGPSPLSGYMAPPPRMPRDRHEDEE